MKLYRELADWWPLLSPPEEYAEEASFYRDLLIRTATRPVTAVLELGSGGGNNASHLKSSFQLTLVDLSPEMLAQSRRLNPECEHIQGDMRSVRLGRLFDAVFVHDAVCYMTTEDDLRRVVETAFLHCHAGGAALFAPDHIRETFREGTSRGGSGDDHRAIRYLEWTHDPDPEDTTYIVDYAYLLREAGVTTVVHDQHVEGLFPRDVWLRLLGGAGFEAEAVPFDNPEEIGIEVFVGLHP